MESIFAAAGYKHQPRQPGDPFTGAGTVKVWNVATRRQVFEYFDDQNEPRSIQFSPKAPILAATFVRKIEVKDNVVEVDLSKPWDPVPVILWNVETGKKVHTLVDENAFSGVSCAAFSPDGKTLAVESLNDTNQVLFWDVQTGKQRGSLPVDDGVEGLQYSPDGTMLACYMLRLVYRTVNGKEVGLFVSDVELIRLADKKRIFRYSSEDDGAFMAFSPDGRWFAVAGRRSAVVELFDLRSQKKAGSFRAYTGWDQKARLCGLAFSPNSKVLYTAGGDFPANKKAQLSWKAWDIETRRLLHVQSVVPVTPQESVVSWLDALAVSPDGQHIATASIAGVVRLWRLPKELRSGDGVKP